MKRTLIALTCLVMAISCAQKEDSGYIGPSDIRIEDGVMTPESLLALGRLSDIQRSRHANTGIVSTYEPGMRLSDLQRMKRGR